MSLALILLLLLLLLLGVPLLVPLLAAALLLLLFAFPGLDPALLIQQMIAGVRPAVLVAVPLFIFAADLMTRGHTAQRLLDLVLTFVGHLRGGLPISAALGCTLFGAVSGSTQATVVAIGGPLRPQLLAAGYRDSFTTALLINASDIALLIPPSIGMIVYGVVTGTAVGELFIAGIGPGLLILLLFASYAWYHSRRHAIPRQPRASWRQRGQALWRAAPTLGFPLLIVGGIYSGLFSPTEAAAMAVLYALLLELLLFRSLKFSDLPAIALSSGLITAVVFILVAAGSAFSWAISFARIPDQLLADLLPLVTGDPTALLLLIAVSYFIGCMFVDPIVVILILSPIFAPLVDSSGLDPVLVGTLVTLQAAIGSATPPFGCDIFTAMAVFRRPYLAVIEGTPPFILLLLLATLLLIWIPEIALWPRDLAFG